MSAKAKGKRKSKRGPSPDRVKIKGDWSEAVKKALEKTRPSDGWPQPQQREPKRRP